MALTRRYMTRTAQSASIIWSILLTPEGAWTLMRPETKGAMKSVRLCSDTECRHLDQGLASGLRSGWVACDESGVRERSLRACAAFQRPVAVAGLWNRLSWSPCR